MASPHYRFNLHCVLADNDGNDVSAHVDVARTVLANRFGGLTETAARGIWISDGREYADAHVILSVDVPWPDSPTAEVFVSAVAEQLARFCRQDCVYVTSHALETSLVKPIYKLEDIA